MAEDLVSKVTGSVNLTPPGIEVFAALLHLLFAHVKNPHAGGTAQHHAEAIAYIRAHQREVKIERLAADAASAEYVVTHHAIPHPRLFRVRIGHPFNSCLQVKSVTGPWIDIDMSHLRVIA